MTEASAAEELLRELGVTDPGEIDLEAIAYHVGAEVRFAPLRGCDARIIGDADRAIITVNSSSPLTRRRFSIAHELGHWRLHRGRHLICKADEVHGKRPDTERVADRYAAQLLMPRYLFAPRVNPKALLTWKLVTELARAFSTSPVATALRLVDLGTHPAIVLCHGQKGRRWFERSPLVPDWFPKEELNAGTSAFSILFGNAPDDTQPRRDAASVWFSRPDAHLYSVMHQSIRFGNEVLTLISIADAR